jgi:hypothetical protein
MSCPYGEPIWVTKYERLLSFFRGARCKEHPMLDAIVLAIGLGFFALSVGYTIACDRL